MPQVVWEQLPEHPLGPTEGVAWIVSQDRWHLTAGRALGWDVEFRTAAAGMRRRRPFRPPWLAGSATLLVVLVLLVGGLSLGRRDGEPASASRAALDGIAAKNREAAIVSAARLKAESGAMAADARRAAAEADPAAPRSEIGASRLRGLNGAGSAP